MNIFYNHEPNFENQYNFLKILEIFQINSLTILKKSLTKKLIHEQIFKWHKHF
jgi:hypothetical protein